MRSRAGNRARPAAALVALALAAGAEAQEPLAARVNGDGIPIARLDRAVEDDLAAKGRSVAALRHPSAYANARRESLDRLIDEELLWQEARREKTVVSEKDLDAALAQFRARYKSDEDMNVRLATAGFTPETYREHVRRAMSLRAFAERIAGSAKVSPSEVHEFYAANPEKFRRGDGVVPEAEARDAIRKRLQQAKGERALRERVARLRESAKIEIFAP